MAVEVIAAWIAAGGAIASAAVSYFAQKGADRAATAAESQTALIAAKTDVWTSDKAIYVERVTAERGIWRSEMRIATAEAVSLLADPAQENFKVKLEHCLTNIALRLNPDGRSSNEAKRNEQSLDRDIFVTIANLRSSRTPTNYRRLGYQLEERVAVLLKQEWNVSKSEAKRVILAGSHTISNNPAAPMPPAVHIDTTT